MDLYNKMLNIKNLNIKKEIEESISKTKQELDNLTENQTCKIYSSKVYEKLTEKGIIARLIDTKDFGNYYSHMFVIATLGKDNYLIDLTYKQFNEEEKLPSLLNNGYILLNEDIFKEYLGVVIKNRDSFTIEDAIYKKR